MSIISSVFDLGSIQRDGRRYCIERHTDHLGIVHVVEYLAEAAANHTTIMNTRALRIAEELKEEELKYAVFDAPWDYVLQWTTNNELAVWVREKYKQDKNGTLALIASRILEWIANGRFTDTQVRNAFGLSAAQWTTLKAKMQTLVDNNLVVQSAVGE